MTVVSMRAARLVQAGRYVSYCRRSTTNSYESDSQVHPHARHAAEVAEAAASQGKFWEMHDTLFARQDALDDADLLKYAAELSLDAERVSRELAGHEHTRRVEEDQQSGLDSGVSGTPTFYIDGTRYDGSVALRDMLAAIRQLHPDLEPGDTAATNPRIPRVRWPRAQRTVARRRD
jgi:predicted DsbA family dithiol-disulfide isomerase